MDYNVDMGISDRISRLAKSYLHSAKDRVAEEWDDLKDKADNGELTSGVKAKIKSFGKQKTKTSDEMKEDIDYSFDDEWEELKRQAHKKPRPTAATKLRDAYAKLGLTESASLEQVDKAYKKELRKYHPDRFPTDPQKAETATKVSQIISEAYQLIKQSKR